MVEQPVKQLIVIEDSGPGKRDHIILRLGVGSILAAPGASKKQVDRPQANPRRNVLSVRRRQVQVDDADEDARGLSQTGLLNCPDLAGCCNELLAQTVQVVDEAGAHLEEVLALLALAAVPTVR